MKSLSPVGAVIAGPACRCGSGALPWQTVPGGPAPKLTPIPLSLHLPRVSERFVVTGGSRLSGEVAVGGAKNSVLKLMAATLLAEGTSTITNCPDILDVPLMAEVLRGLGATVELDGDVVRITSPDEPKYDADFAAVRQFRASVCVLGPLVGRCKRARGGASRRRRHRLAAPGHAPGRPAAAGRTLQHRARLRGRRSRYVARRRDSAGVPLGGSYREHPDGRRAWPRASPPSTMPRANPTSSICARCSTRWARRSRVPVRRR